MKSIELYGTVSDSGVLNISGRDRLTDWCKQNRNKHVKIKVERQCAKRSLPQNSYYHSVVVELVRDGLYAIGYCRSHDETHFFLKNKFNLVEIPNKDGVAIEMPGSTTDLNKVQFGEYIERIAQWAAEYLSVVIPPPDKDYKVNV